MLQFEVTIADSPSALTTEVVQVEALSERAAFRQVAATLPDEAVVRFVTEVDRDLTYEEMRALEREARAKQPKAKPKAKPKARLDWRTIVGADDR